MSEAVDVTFSAPIGVEVKGETWACVEVPDSAELLGTPAAFVADPGPIDPQSRSASGSPS